MHLRLDEGAMHDAMIQFLTNKLKQTGMTTTMKQQNRKEARLSQSKGKNK